MKERKTISIYGCGGAGINVATKVLNINTNAVGFPEVEYTLIDTSESNRNEKWEGKNSYLIPGLDGTGKERSFCYEQAVPHIDPILTKFKPQDASIVIYSLSGGTGSVCGPLLVQELLARGECVISVCIANTSTGKEAENTLRSIGTLQGISKSTKQPVVALFYDNSSAENRDNVDSRIENDVRALAMLLSGCNEELDTIDIKNFLYYEKGAKVPAQLVDMIVYSENSSNAPEGFTPIAVASVLPDRSYTTLKMNQPYGCTGYLPRGIIESSKEDIKSIHYLLTNAYIGKRIEGYSKIDKEFKSVADSLKMVPEDALDGVGNGEFFL